MIMPITSFLCVNLVVWIDGLQTIGDNPKVGLLDFYRRQKMFLQFSELPNIHTPS